MSTSPRKLSPAVLKAALHDGGEIALLDAREEMVFDGRHLLMAACVPLSRVELMADASVPRRSTRVVWCDDGEGLAESAAARMLALGYTDVSVLDGGLAAWEKAGYRIYNGVHVPSKAFAEVIEHETHTPWISAEQLKAMIDSKADMVVFDSRSYEEFHTNSIPTAISVPGAELVYRFADLVPSPDTLVVVNCGGRTRSIIGAQSLINAGVPNKVVSLKNGTQGWALAGYPVLKGITDRAPAVSPAGQAAARAAADRVAARYGIPRIDEATLARWQAESNHGTAARTLYVFDVRSPEEYRVGHVPGMKHVAGGQLVQETERHATTWGARVVLVDDDGVRAVMTAHWMKQMGWEVSALTLDLKALGTEAGPWQPPVLGLEQATATLINATALQQRLQAGGVSVIDVDWSRDYYAGHIPGAWYGIRSRLAAILPQLPAGDAVVFTSGDGALARLAADDARSLTKSEVLALAGGTAAWRRAGLPLEQGATRMGTRADDLRIRAREQSGDVKAAMEAYLSWEIELVNQMATDDDQRFCVMGSTHA
jgi:rhodanese-related sulfurtransferase